MREEGAQTTRCESAFKRELACGGDETADESDSAAVSERMLARSTGGVALIRCERVVRSVFAERMTDRSGSQLERKDGGGMAKARDRTDWRWADKCLWGCLQRRALSRLRQGESRMEKAMETKRRDPELTA